MFFRPFWKFNYRDKTTWKYLGYDIEKVDNDKFIRWKRNDEFAYEHLSPYGKEISWNIVK